jgi:hypothetical protein
MNKTFNEGEVGIFLLWQEAGFFISVLSQEELALRSQEIWNAIHQHGEPEFSVQEVD